jgi:peptidoglycan L-alanyl-D-glutamate endopeptidase CwlK
MTVLKNPCHGQDALTAQCALAAAGFYSGDLDGSFGPGTEAAVIAFQKQNGLPPTGIVDSQTAAALGITDPAPVSSKIPAVTVEMVSQMFPGTPVANIQANLPHVLNALADAGLGDRQMVLMALATIRAETASFLPISEFISINNNTSPPGDRPFDMYDNASRLGNQGSPDGSNFRGRGFIQLTGRFNYTFHGAAIGLGTGLIDKPIQANDPAIAAKLLASFLKANEADIRNALASNNLDTARRLVNGGHNGFPQFEDAFNIGSGILPKDPLLASSTSNGSS